jgi:hypothetical protein
VIFGTAPEMQEIDYLPYMFEDVGIVTVSAQLKLHNLLEGRILNRIFGTKNLKQFHFLIYLPPRYVSCRCYLEKQEQNYKF